MAQPKFLWNVGYLEQLESELQDTGRKVLCLSPVSFRLLANMSQMLTWPTRFGLTSGDELPDLAKIAYQEMNIPITSPLDCWTESDIEDWIKDTDKMTIIINNTNNCSSCSGSTGITNLYCVREDGTVEVTPYTPPPLTPDPPPGTTFPIDVEVDDPPTGYGDWEEYDSQACIAANFMWYFAKFFVNVLETIADWVAAFAALVTLITPLMPAEVLLAIGGVTFLEILHQLVNIVVSEQATDILNEISDWLDLKRDDLVCAIYSHRYDFGQVLPDFLENLTDYVQATVTMDASERNAVENFVTSLFTMTIFYSVIADQIDLYKVFTDADPEDMVDCSQCLAPGATSYDYDELFTTGKGRWGGGIAWRADNGGEAYTIASHADKEMTTDRTQMLNEFGEAHNDVEAWYASQVTFYIARNTSQADDTEFYAEFRYRDGTVSQVARQGTTDATYQAFDFVNPNPTKPLWDSQAAGVPGVVLVFPADPDSSTWYEYFITRARLQGGFVIGTYVDYGDTR